MMIEKSISSPKVSVIMPAYNAEDFIEEAIRSVIAQTEQDWELIVIDDGSSDSTETIVTELAAADKRILFLKNSQNMGTAGTRNRGIRECRGEYIAFLDSDDVWHPDKLQKQLSLAERENADIVYCSYTIINEADQIVCNNYIVPAQTDFDALLVENVIGCSTVLLKKSSLADHCFTKDFYHEDFVLWLKLLSEGKKACGITEVLADYRYRANSRAYNKIASAKNRWKIYRDCFHIPLIQSIHYILHYALLGVKKYQKVR